MPEGLPPTWKFPQNVKNQHFFNQRGKTWISVISMEKPWKFEIRVKGNKWISQFWPILANFCNERGKKRGFRGFLWKNRGKSWKLKTRVN